MYQSAARRIAVGMIPTNPTHNDVINIILLPCSLSCFPCATANEPAGSPGAGHARGYLPFLSFVDSLLKSRSKRTGIDIARRAGPIRRDTDADAPHKTILGRLSSCPDRFRVKGKQARCHHQGGFTGPGRPAFFIRAARSMCLMQCPCCTPRIAGNEKAAVAVL